MKSARNSYRRGKRSLQRNQQWPRNGQLALPVLFWHSSLFGTNSRARFGAVILAVLPTTPKQASFPWQQSNQVSTSLTTVSMNISSIFSPCPSCIRKISQFNNSTTTHSQATTRKAISLFAKDLDDFPSGTKFLVARALLKRSNTWPARRLRGVHTKMCVPVHIMYVVHLLRCTHHVCSTTVYSEFYWRGLDNIQVHHTCLIKSIYTCKYTCKNVLPPRYRIFSPKTKKKVLT